MEKATEVTMLDARHVPLVNIKEATRSIVEIGIPQVIFV